MTTVDTSGLEALPDELKKLIFTQYASQVKEVVGARAKGDAHVITGNMRNLIQPGPTVVEGDVITMFVNSGAEYAVYEERRPGHSYMRPAVEKTLDQVNGLLQDAVKKVFE